MVRLWLPVVMQRETQDTTSLSKVTNDGQELVEEIKAKNDTDALKLYLDRMEKILVENMDKPDQQQYKVMYVISPDGDTLNTNEQLLQSIVIPTATAQ